MLLLTITTLVSCQKEVSNESSTDDSAVKGVLKMKIDGTQWVADKLATASIMAGYIILQASVRIKNCLPLRSWMMW